MNINAGKQAYKKILPSHEDSEAAVNERAIKALKKKAPVFFQILVQCGAKEAERYQQSVPQAKNQVAKALQETLRHYRYKPALKRKGVYA
jgi:hypothetical protein